MKGSGNTQGVSRARFQKKGPEIRGQFSNPRTLVADPLRSGDAASAGRHHALPHYAAVATTIRAIITIGLSGTIPTVPRTPPVSWSDSSAEWANLHASPARTDAGSHLRAGGCG